MSEEFWIHDSEVNGYYVEKMGQALEITLFLKEENGRACTLKFTDVLGFDLVGMNNFQNVLLGIFPEALEKFVEDTYEKLVSSEAIWQFTSKSKSEILEFLLENHYQVYGIYASLGLNGWVITKREYELKENYEKQM